MGHGEGLIPVRKAGACVADAAIQVGTYTLRRFRVFLFIEGGRKCVCCECCCRHAVIAAGIVTLPVLLHPSDGFVFVELPLELVLLQS